MRNSGNSLLASLSESDASALRPHLKSIYLDHERVLFEAGDKVVDIYFPTRGDHLAGGGSFLWRNN
jgi:hypothetical protein